MVKKADIEASQLIAASILTMCLEQGLRKQTISINSLSAELKKSIDASLFDDVVSWLKSERLIRFDQTLSDDEDPTVSYYSGCQVTAHGFAILQQRNPVGISDEQFGQTLQNVNDQKDLSRIGDLIGGIFGGFTKSMSG